MRDEVETESRGCWGGGAGFRARPGPSKRRNSWWEEKLWDQRDVCGEFQLLQAMDCDFSFASLQETFLKVQGNMHFFLRLCGMMALDPGWCGVRADFPVACPSWVLLLNKLFRWNFPCQAFDRSANLARIKENGFFPYLHSQNSATVVKMR